MAGPLVLVEKQLYFLGFGVLGLHVAFQLLFQSRVYLQPDGHALFINQLELHVDSELDNCNQMKGLDTDRALIQGQFDILSLAEKIFLN